MVIKMKKKIINNEGGILQVEYQVVEMLTKSNNLKQVDRRLQGNKVTS